MLFLSLEKWFFCPGFYVISVGWIDTNYVNYTDVFESNAGWLFQYEVFKIQVYLYLCITIGCLKTNEYHIEIRNKGSNLNPTCKVIVSLNKKKNEQY